MCNIFCLSVSCPEADRAASLVPWWHDGSRLENKLSCSSSDGHDMLKNLCLSSKSCGRLSMLIFKMNEHLLQVKFSAYKMFFRYNSMHNTSLKSLVSPLCHLYSWLQWASSISYHSHCVVISARLRPNVSTQMIPWVNSTCKNLLCLVFLLLLRDSSMLKKLPQTHTNVSRLIIWMLKYYTWHLFKYAAVCPRRIWTPTSVFTF